MTQRTDTESRNRPSTTDRRGRENTRDKKLARRRRRRLLMEGLENRQLLNAASGTPGTTPAPVDPSLFDAVEPRNVGSVQAFNITEQELATEIGFNDTRFNPQFIPLGTGPGEQDTIDLTGSLPIQISSQGNINTDLDTYAFDLRAGDILDISVFGAGANLTVLNEDGSLWFGTDTNQGVFHPDNSPLMTTGNAVAAQVVPEDGRYFLVLAPSLNTVNYTTGLRVYRPVAESLPIGAQQTLYLDFEGGVYPSSLFGANPLGLTLIRFSSLRQNLDFLGLEDTGDAAYNELIDKIMLQVESDFQSVVRDGGNGDYDTTGTPGDFGINILNSRDVQLGLYPEPSLNDPLVTRIYIGGTVGDSGIDGILGIAQSLDIGNFDMSENSIMPIDFFLPASTIFPISNSKSVLDAVARRIGTTASHEAGHTFGLRHQNGDNAIGAIMDDPGVRRDEFRLGVGPDGIFGTNDDTLSVFANDQFSLNEGLFGFQNTPAALAYSLSTGTAGTTISGNVFNDTNRDGNSNGDVGLGGVTVFADVDLDGEIDPTEPTTTTDASGNYQLRVAPGTYVVVAQTPTQFAATTASSQNVSVSNSAPASGVNFGFNQVISDITGTKWADTNGNGIFDANESGVEGFYIYLDLDGDDRPDLGEPSDITGPDGTYSINFPGPGTYTIREVVPPGFIQTFPATGEHTVIFNGVALTDNFDFGNLPSRDYGDAPDSYQTSVATGGPSHGLDPNVFLGAEVDRETDGIPSSDALGDDQNNIDDEDGIQLLSPLGPGGVATFEVNTTNTSGFDSFLNGWIDFDGDGVFSASEQVFDDVVLGSGTTNLDVSVPSSAAIGTTYARFRYSPTSGLGPAGEADSGEVEDYQFDILQAAQIANDDEFTVSRNSLSNLLDVLANDFETSVTQLRIIGLNVNGTAGTPVISGDGRAIFYTPSNGFTGRDTFQYVVRDSFNNTFTATVNVNVNFQSNVPIAVDDTFEVPQGSSNRALNVLDNDVPSIFGGLTITSVTAGDQGGQVTIEGGGQTIRYTPQPGFAGTEQFNYSVQDANGAVSIAQVTVNSLPGAQFDDLLDFSIGVFDVTNDTPISNVQVGDEFRVRVFVNELNNPAFSPRGVASAFLDLLYTDELVSTQDTDGSALGFDISFGEIFQGGFQLGDATVPGLIDDVGSVQPIPTDGQLTQHSDPVELFTITMNAISPGVALFAADPADSSIAESILVGEDVALTPSQLRLGRTELTIFPAGDDFASAIDDAFVNGTDSNGTVISSGNAPNILDVLDNDNFGPTGVLQEFGIATAPALGNATINDAGTPGDPSDDFIEYVANVGANGFDSFTYLIVSGDGVRSTAEVTMAIGNAGADDIVEISMGLVDELGNPITSVQSGDLFGVQILVEDLRSALEGNTAVFAAYTDVLYDAGLITPAEPRPIDGDRYDFRVAFDADFDADAGVGTAVRDGIIDEFGSLLVQAVAEGGAIAEPNLMATIFFVAGNVTSSTTTTFTTSPADASPFQDTLLIDRDDPVEVSEIRFNTLSLTILPAGPQQNTALPEDVNDDGLVTPSDALAVINELARAGEGEFGGSSFYTDVNGDSETTAIDALRVINHMARAFAAELAEGESVGSALLSSGDAEGEDAPVDQAIADLSGGSKLVGGTTGGGQAGGVAASDFLDLGSDGDDDDDVLGLLADDQSSL